jgi:hypothetical protein
MKEQAIEFLKWCNTPMYRDHGVLNFSKRVIPQFPDYNTYIIIDKSGRSVLGDGVFLDAEGVYDYWVNN